MYERDCSKYYSTAAYAFIAAWPLSLPGLVQPEEEARSIVEELTGWEGRFAAHAIGSDGHRGFSARRRGHIEHGDGLNRGN